MRRKPPLPFVQAFGGYHYFRRTGFPRVRLPGLLFSPEFMAAYQEAMASAPAPIGASRSKPGSVAATVAAYFASPAFAQLAAGTQANRRGALQRFRDQHGGLPIMLMPQRFITTMIGTLKPHAAVAYLKTLRALCQFALAAELIKVDPTQGIRLPKAKGGRRRGWSPAEIEAYEAKHPIGTKARLALALGVYTLQRRGDVIRMGPRNIEGGMISLQQQKTGAALTLPVRPELRAILDATPLTGLSTFLVTKSGRRFTGANFSAQFRVWCDAAGLPETVTYHGLRATGCTLLADAGATAHEIAAWSGHMTLAEVQRYTKGADQKRLARSALTKLMTYPQP
jgi:integrase